MIFTRNPPQIEYKSSVSLVNCDVSSFKGLGRTFLDRFFESLTVSLNLWQAGASYRPVSTPKNDFSSKNGRAKQ